MTVPPQTPSRTRPLLSLTPLTPAGAHGRSSRDPQTCLFRCGNACDHPEPNPTDNPHVQAAVTRAVGRRRLLQGAALGSGALVLGVTESAAADPSSAEKAVAGSAEAQRAALAGGDLGLADFRPVPPNRRDAVAVAAGFTSSVVMRWGDKVLPGAPEFDAYRQTAEAAMKQFGFNCDYVGLVPVEGRPNQALLVVNHEYTTAAYMFPADVYTDDEKRRIEMASHGMSVVLVRRGATPGSWKQVTPVNAAAQNRRIHTGTPFRVVGPAAGDDLLKTTADPSGTRVLGTLNNCAGGMTPWGTVLSGEENFNQYFEASGALDSRYTAQYARYGIRAAGSRNWKATDARFDLTAEPHEPHRFGWVVEVDPSDPTSTPRKHTMLGRFKHEGANVVLDKSGRAVAYMGDDEKGDYLYKFVSSGKFDGRGTRAARTNNLKLLTAGTLFVAKLTGDGDEDGVYDGTGEWIPLANERRSFVPGMSLAEVLVFTRLAADLVQPTKMDRPEDVEPNPVTGKVYAALTNNDGRGTAQAADEANPVTSSMVRSAPSAPLTPATGNRNGYVLEIAPDRSGHLARTFTWNLLLVCGDPAASETYFGGFDKEQVSPISCPDNLSFDSTGNLWVSTDGNALGGNDGIFRVPTEGPDRGKVQQFLSVPRGAEACGPLVIDEDRSLFVAVQHPGEITGATFEAPASTWPHTDDFPRPAVCVAYLDR
ncbi:PhoX family phosphatase [Nocardioides marinquilinus]|uniref:PhoX family phosphatase n=1 Tax=Nocardioides marinquilinus TaxID=1210400 RepID=A0ABP9PM62_9ACTN